MSKKSVKKTTKTIFKKGHLKSGRPKGTVRFGDCPVKNIRVPAHLVEEILEFAVQQERKRNPQNFTNKLDF